MGNSMPIGGGALNCLASLTAYGLKNNEYNRYQNRMSLITSVGTIQELTDVARQVARKLADRYERQLLCLEPPPDQVSEVCCCNWCLCKKKKDSPCCKKSQNTQDDFPKKIASFGVAFVVETIIKEDIKKLKHANQEGLEYLADTLVEIICSAQPTISERALKKMNLQKSTILPHRPIGNTNEGERPTQWYLHDFYRKPGIMVIRENGIIEYQDAVLYMEPNLYGYRLGTLDEYNGIAKNNLVEVKSGSCCAC